MSEIEELKRIYEAQVRAYWDPSLAGPQKTWFAIYDPIQERRLRLHLSDFESATKNAGHSWKLVDLTDTFAKWMATQEYRESYFQQPELLDLALSDFTDHVVKLVEESLLASDVDNNTVVAIVGTGSLYGLTRASVIMERVAKSIKGRLVLFFPGKHEGHNYRLLDARDGWNYLALPLSADDTK